jgi:ribosomal peptide maturation radical SAM protein 1
MKVLLVSMPWAAVDSPSLALGILKQEVSDLRGVEVSTVYANIDWADWLAARSPFQGGDHIHLFGFRDYAVYSIETYFRGLGDWTFSAALHGVQSWRVAEFRDVLCAGLEPRLIELTVALHEMAPAFIDELADRLVADGPDVIGLTTTFQQNAASLALARAVKSRNPRIVTVFGGANCDGPQGEALHRNFGFVDHVVRGEGEAAFRALLGVLRKQPAADARPSLAAIAGLCWRDERGESTVNTMPGGGLSLTGCPKVPDFSEYFARFASSTLPKRCQPRLVVEGSRGCWWGQKHHCTFCGLNGAFMEFRSKSPAAFAQEVLTLVERHQVLDISVVDNILAPEFITSALAVIAEKGYDLRMFCEIKSNMRREQLEALLAAGVTGVQPGIENLSTHVLKIMDKGVTGCLNVRLLRDAASIGTQVSWNFLYGFPGEEEHDYRSVLEQFPALHHLPPPDGAGRIAIERFSPYFDRPELGFTQLTTARMYPVIYDLPAGELADLAYIFESAPLGITGETITELQAAIARWRSAYFEGRSRLTYCDTGEAIILVSYRDAFPWRTLVIDDPDEAALFRQLEQPRSAASLAAFAGQSLGGRVDVARLLTRWTDLGLLFSDGGQLIAVAAEARNQELTRVSPQAIAVRAAQVRTVRETPAAAAPGGDARAPR